jgi:hypothetical protein
MTLELWAFRAEVPTEGADLRGMAVQALDGGIGKVTDVVEHESRTFLLVDTGPWIFGKTIKLPAGLVAGFDPAQGIVLVDRAKDDIKDAPEQDGDLADDSAHADALARHYAGGPDEAAPVAAPSASPEAPAATALGGVADGGGVEGAAPGDAGPGFLEREAEGDDEPPIPAPPPPLDAGTIEARPGAADGDRAESGAPASEAGADTVAPPFVSDAPAPSAPEPDAAEPAGAGDDAAPATAGGPGPGTPEPPKDDAPSPLSGLVTDTPPEVEPPVSDQPPPPKDEPAPEPRRRRASAPSRGRAAERPDRAPARKRTEAPSRETPARKRAEAPSRARPADTGKKATTRARGESAPAPAKRQTRSGGGSRNDQPIARYDALTAAEVVGRLRALTQSELAKVERYEKRGDSRRTILKRVASLREKEPWRGYDTATVKEVRERLARAKEDRATAVRDYERRHRNRTGVMDAARRRLETM